MNPDSPAWPPADCAGWIALRQGAPADDAEQCRLAVADALRALARRQLARLNGENSTPDDGRLDGYVGRVWHCTEFHWRRWSETEPLAFDAVLARLETGELGFGYRGTDVVFEVVLAQALQSGTPKAAEMFDSDYMPKVRSVARHLGGQRAVDVVENFAAELILPRDGRPPRIASFQGRTPLASWLRAVVTNYWISQTRKRQSVNLPVLPESPADDGDPAAVIDGRPCEELLRPVFSDALRPLEAEDRLLMKMLLLDGVGQNELARAFGVHSGTLTRRRQRAAAAVLDRVRELVEQHASPRQVGHCLELALAGNDARLRERLADVLAAGIRGDTWGGLPRPSGWEHDGLGSPPHDNADGLGSPPHGNADGLGSPPHESSREVDKRG
ncbi:MAG TPA: hypothetical protein PK867_17595 [Pirellulales bacterium]|nr:hypothetical protein [Pirellulales bacterium]